MHMTCFELIAALDDLGLQQKQLARLCGVGPIEVWRWVNGKTRVPGYVRTILSFVKNPTTPRIMNGQMHHWPVERHHVFRKGRSFGALLKQWHPDRNKRDTTREMQSSCNSVDA